MKSKLKYVLVSVLVTAASLSHANAAATTVLDAAFITGSTTYSVKDLASVTGARVGHTISQELVDRIAADVQALYRRDGYVAPSVMAIDFSPLSSTPRLHVFEANVTEVAIRGDVGPYREVIDRHARQLQSGALHKQRSLQHLRAIEDLPGMHLRATFEPRPDLPNSHLLVLDLQYSPVEVNVDIHNRGTDEVGPLLMSGRVKLNGLLGMQESLSFIGATSGDWDEYRYFNVRAERQFGVVNSNFTIATSNAEPSGDFRYSTDRARLETRATLFDDGNLRIEPLLALGLRNSEGKDAAGVVFTRTDTRVAEAGVAAQKSSQATRTYFLSTVARGIDGAGADAFSRYRTPADLEFTKLQVDLMHVYAFAPSWQLRADAEGQWSNDDLPVGEHYTFGGARFGRGFDPAALIADSGMSLSMLIERALRWRMPWVQNARVFVQGDYGYASDDGDDSDAAASFTFGVGAKIAAMLTSVELSQPLLDPDNAESGHDARAFVHMHMTF